MKQKAMKFGAWAIGFAVIFAVIAAFTPATLHANEGTVLRFVVGSTTFSVDGTDGTLDAAVFNQDGRVMVPLRQIGEAIGAATIAFEDNTAIIDDIRLPIGVALAGGMGTPVIVEGRTFVPLGYIAQAIGASARYGNSAASARSRTAASTDSSASAAPWRTAAASAGPDPQAQVPAGSTMLNAGEVP